MTKKEITVALKKYNISYSYDEDGDILIESCALSERNGYDYGEPKPKLKIDKKELQFLKKEPKVRIIRCEDCGSCGGWQYRHILHIDWRKKTKIQTLTSNH